MYDMLGFPQLATQRLTVLREGLDEVPQRRAGHVAHGPRLILEGGQERREHALPGVHNETIQNKS